jgi:hypothetical protein
MTSQLLEIMMLTQDYTGDIYNKAATVLHTLRQVMNDDEKWRAILTV